MSQNESPVPQKTEQLQAEQPQPEFLPICGRCDLEVKAIKFLDYGDIRIVFHDPNGCVLGIGERKEK